MAHRFRRVLCPLDFSANTELTIDTARQLAEQNGATLVLFHVAEDSTLDAKKRLDRIADEKLDNNIPYEIEVVAGEAAKEILQAANRDGADLIVMATHGRSGLDHFVLGSVAERVVRESPVPVLTVRGSSGDRVHIPKSVLL